MQKVQTSFKHMKGHTEREQLVLISRAPENRGIHIHVATYRQSQASLTPLLLT